ELLDEVLMRTARKGAHLSADKERVVRLRREGAVIAVLDQEMALAIEKEVACLVVLPVAAVDAARSVDRERIGLLPSAPDVHLTQAGEPAAFLDFLQIRGRKFGIVPEKIGDIREGIGRGEAGLGKVLGIGIAITRAEKGSQGTYRVRARTGVDV